MANGGVIQEPVNGIGLRTGATYSFAERGPETVIPNGGGLAGSTRVYQPTIVTGATASESIRVWQQYQREQEFLHA